jgi:ABC-type multidrug transport system ATPase subunit
MDEAIRTERLTKYYGGRKVVDHLDLRIPYGTVYGLLGRNGAGKSTTLKMLTGMVRPDYDGGEANGAAGSFPGNLPLMPAPCGSRGTGARFPRRQARCA